ncbi:MAG: TonB-dependent receptor [Bacteroidota bacterium]
MNYRFILQFLLVIRMVSCLNLIPNRVEAHAVEKVPLADALKILSENYEVLFTYDSDLISQIKVEYEYQEGEKFEAAIYKIFEQTGLKYNSLGGKYYLIYRDNKQGRSKAKKFNRKIRQLKKLEEGGDLYANWGTSSSFQKILAPGRILGQVVDKTGKPLIGAVLAIENSRLGAFTDEKGRYEIKLNAQLPKSFFLYVSYLGYKEQQIKIQNEGGADLVQDFIMEEDLLQLKDIVVYARKKSENQQEVPMSITTLNDVELRQINALNMQDIATRIPNISFGPQGGGGVGDGLFSNQFSIRGITGFNTTGFYIDELPMPENITPQLIDVSRVEVLRGPQGTLYGSSSMGGAIKVITNLPNVEKFEANASASFAFQEEGDPIYTSSGMVNLPLLPNKLALRAVGFFNQRGGIFDRQLVDGEILSPGETLSNTFTENIDQEKTYGFHASLGFKPSENLSITPKVIYQRTEGSGYPFADISADNFVQERVVGIPEPYENRFANYSLTAELDLGSGSLISSTSFIDWDYEENEDATEFIAAAFGTPFFYAAPINRPVDYTRFVEEARYSSDWKGPIQIIAGIFFSDESYKPAYTSVMPGFGDVLNLGSAFDNIFVQTGFTDTREIAVFGELTYDLSDQWAFTAGLRAFDAKLERFRSTYGVVINVLDSDNPAIQQGTQEESGINPKFNLTYKLSPGNIIYASAAKGFRLGGVNEEVPEVFCGRELDSLNIVASPTYDADKLWNYELGFKPTLADGKLLLNLAAFFVDWSEIQQRRQLSCGFPFIGNVGAAASKGLELDLKIRPILGLDFGFNMGYVDARITESAAALDAGVGDRIQNVPQLSANGYAKYYYDLDTEKNMFLYVRGDFQAVGRSFTTFDQSLEERTKDPFQIVNFKAGLRTEKLDIALFVDNLTNEHANFGDVISIAAEMPGRPRYATNRPRSIGIVLNWNY